MKFVLKCKECKHEIPNFQKWFEVKQACPKCGSHQADVVYLDEMKGVKKLVDNKTVKPDSVWYYFDYLPLNNQKNIVSVGDEGVVPIEKWDFFEKFAKEKYGLNIKVYAHRNDRHIATGTFKDLAGTVVASVLKETGVKNYVAASTGNIGVAYSHYLAKARISLSVFIPNTSLKSQEAEIGSFGQSVFRVDGDYAAAKKMAKDFAAKHNVILTGGNFDPMRIEAKKTMVYEWLRVMPYFPTVFMQAISGGSGPLGIAKATEELAPLNLCKMPRFILPQPHRCAPMAEAWKTAKAENFPENWEAKYPVYENPETTIETLSTGNPTAYPALAKVVKKSAGEIISCQEENAIDVTRLIAYEKNVRIGPAAAITVVGFFQSLRDGLIVDGDVVMLNIGEGVSRSHKYVEKLKYSSQFVSKLDDAKLMDRNSYREKLWQAVEAI